MGATASIADIVEDHINEACNSVVQKELHADGKKQEKQIDTERERYDHKRVESKLFDISPTNGEEKGFGQCKFQSFQSGDPI